MCQIEELLADIEKGADLGPEISQNVAESFLKTISRQLSKESKAKLRETLKTPLNCKQFSPPKISNEIWKIIPSQARLQDVKQQQSQQALSVGLSALSIITSQVLIRKSQIPNEVVSSIVKLAIDAANVLGDQSQQVNSNRKMDLKRYLNPDFYNE